MGQSTRTRPKDWTAFPQQAQDEGVRHTHPAGPAGGPGHGGPFPKRKSDAENMDIYRRCRGKFGTSPKVECRGSSDCRLGSDKCPEHIASKGGMAAPSALGRATDRTSTPQKMPSSCYFVKDCNVTLYILLLMPL